MSNLHEIVELKDQQTKIANRCVSVSAAETARVYALAKPFLTAWITALATQSKIEIVINSHIWRVSLNQVDDWTIQVSETTPWLCQIVHEAAKTVMDIDRPKSLALLHKAMGVKVPEASDVYAMVVSNYVIMNLLATIWNVRSLMPAQADDLFVFGAEWFRQVSLASMGHYKLPKDRIVATAAAASSEEPEVKRVKK